VEFPEEKSMHRRLFLPFLSILLAACSSTSVTPAHIPAPATGSPVISAVDTPIPPAGISNTPLAPSPDLPVVLSPTLLRIDFQDANNGWGIAANEGGTILRTVDGETTWLNATPPGLTGIGYSTDIYVMDVNNTWMQVPNVDFFTGMLYRSSDGGLTWSSFAAPFGGAIIQFLDASNGRALASRGVGLGSNSVEMYQTSDGGATWISVFNNDPTRSDSSDSLPLSGIKNGMTFLDANTGWVTGTRPVGGEVYLFITHDGGVSWAQQSIPLPPGYEIYQYMPQAPVFFGGTGFLPLMIYLSATTDFTFFTTHDGGASWSGDPANTNDVITPGHYAFVDPIHGWCWDGGINLYFTTDGAKTWSRMLTSLDLSGRLSQLEFVPGTAGQFIGWTLTSMDDAGRSQLYKTTDNGITWMQLIP
jgi:photosystem II stability/assembly factor-like uncharacterized protein